MIPFIKTNVPQFCIACETNNNLWGRTLNPWNQKRTVGGSSGGEGGAISSRCSFIGVGSDIGGSIRIPSEFCGLFGLKPSSRRISGSYHAELALSLHSFGKNIPVCTGPMGKSARDLALFMDIATHESFF
jgi:amidase